MAPDTCMPFAALHPDKLTSLSLQNLATMSTMQELVLQITIFLHTHLRKLANESFGSPHQRAWSVLQSAALGLHHKGSTNPLACTVAVWLLKSLLVKGTKTIYGCDKSSTRLNPDGRRTHYQRCLAALHCIADNGVVA